MSNKTDVTLLDRISNIMAEFGTTKEAVQTREDSIGGKSTHESANAASGEETATEKGQTADNAAYNREHVQGGTDSTSDATPGSETTQGEVQEGDALPTGEWPKDKPDDRPSDVATAHPADASVGPKYSEDLGGASIDDLLKMATELGNELSAALATGFLTEDEGAPKPEAKKSEGKQAGDANVAAKQGAADAQQAVQAEDDQAAQVIESVVKSACHRAELTAGYLTEYLNELSQAAENQQPQPATKQAFGAPPMEDPAMMGPEEPGGGDEEAALAALLAALQGGGGMPGAGMPGEGEIPPEEIVDETIPGEDEAANELLAAMAGPPEEELAAGQDALGGMPDEEALLQLLASLEEEGGTEEDLKYAGDAGVYLAKSASEFRKSGKYQYKGAKRGSTERKVREYIKSYVNELYKRNKS